MLDRIVGLWRRRNGIALLAFAAPASMVLGLVTSLPNIYRSTASILVERQQVPEAFVRPTVTGEVETRLQTITQEIFSRTSLEGLITRFNLYPRLRARLSTQNLVARMRNDIILVMKSDATNPGGAKMVAFTISYRGSDPAVVAEVTNTLAALFIDENLRVRSRQATGTANFLRAQLEETTGQLDVQERQVSDFNRKHMGELPQLRTQYTEKYPEVARVKAEIAALEREQNEKKSDAPSEAATPTPQDPSIRRLKAALTEVDAEVKALRKDESRLQAATARYQARADNTPLREQEFQELSRNYQTTKDHYQSLLKRYQEAQLAEDMEQRQK